VPPVTLPVLLRRYWLQRLATPLAWLILVFAWFVLGPSSDSVPEYLALLASVGALAFVAFLPLTVLGALLGGLSLDSAEIGVGRVVIKRFTPWGTVTVRWLPVEVRLNWLPNRSVRLFRLRLALPYALPLVAFLATYLALLFVPAVAQWTGIGSMTILYAALAGLITMIASLWALSRASSANLAVSESRRAVCALCGQKRSGRQPARSGRGVWR
jgi:hypothetical protein